MAAQLAADQPPSYADVCENKPSKQFLWWSMLALWKQNISPLFLMLKSDNLCISALFMSIARLVPLSFMLKNSEATTPDQCKQTHSTWDILLCPMHLLAQFHSWDINDQNLHSPIVVWLVLCDLVSIIGSSQLWWLWLLWLHWDHENGWFYVADYSFWKFTNQWF